MKLFYTNASAKEEIALLESKIQGLESDATEASGQIASLQADLSTANETISTQAGQISALNADLETANKTISAQAATIEANPTEEQIAERVENAAQAKLASLGGSPIESTKNDQKEGKADLSALTGFSKVSAFFAQKK